MSIFTTRDDSGALLVTFNDASGLNDFRNTPLRDALFDLVQAREEPRVAIDMNKVDYLSSSGVAILVGLKRRIETRNGKVVLYRLQTIVRDLLHVMKLDRYFVIVDGEEEAVASLRSVSSV